MRGVIALQVKPMLLLLYRREKRPCILRSATREAIRGRGPRGLKPSISGQFGVFVCRETNKAATDNGLEEAPSEPKRLAPCV